MEGGKGSGLLAAHSSAAHDEGVEPALPPCDAQGAVVSVSFMPDVKDKRDASEMLRRGSDEGSPAQGAASKLPVVLESASVPSARSDEKTICETHFDADATLMPPDMLKPPKALE